MMSFEHLEDALIQKARHIKLLAMDVDGVLTDGKIIYDSQGHEIKAFFVQDGLGLALLKKFGFHLAIITGRNSPMVERRAKELGIEHIIQGRDDKLVALHTLSQTLGLPMAHCAYIGDDLPDISAIKQAGLGLSVPNASAYTKKAADYVTTYAGGQGAIREVCELILFCQGYTDKVLELYNN